MLKWSVLGKKYIQNGVNKEFSFGCNVSNWLFFGLRLVEKYPGEEAE